jgi:uncharacterized protein (TIGR00269 family)
MRCSKCARPSILYQPYSGLHLCEQHFYQDFEHKVRRELRKSGIKKKDRIGVAISGGKDSSVALYLLKDILEKRKVEILAISIDEGIKGYRRRTLGAARKVVSSLGIEHHIYHFSRFFGITLDRIVERKRENPCTSCGILRRFLLNRVAKSLGLTKIATGHNLDDEAQSILMNYLRGDVEKLKRYYPSSVEGLIPRIKPLKDVPEKEVALYAILKKIPFRTVECPYAGSSLRQEIRELLNDYEIRHPGTKYSIMRGFERIYPYLKESEKMKFTCRICGEPSSRNECEACKLLGDLVQRKNYL